MNFKNILFLTGITLTNAKGKNVGAGGMNTNVFGKRFEFKTNNKERLLTKGFIKKVFGNLNYLTNANTKMNTNEKMNEKIRQNKNIVFVLQKGLKKYMMHKYNIELFRCPDEAYIIEDKVLNKTVVKILEKCTIDSTTLIDLKNESKEISISPV